MVKEIRIYVEGGGNKREGKAQIRQGFGQFLNGLRNVARNKGIKWQIIACGSRESTFKDFKNALESHPEAFNILLVDAEGPVRPKSRPSKHLFQQDGWSMSGISDEQCQLMVQMVESWLIADIDALKQFYKQGFNPKPIPKNPNVENISKQTIEKALQVATKNTRKKTYHKIRHGPKILARLDTSKVRQAADHCNRLFEILTAKMNS